MKTIIHKNKNNKLYFAPELNDDFYAQSYELRKKASTMTDVTISWFQNNIQSLIKETYPQSKQDDSFSVLSIGSGEGDIDMEIINSLLSNLNKQNKSLKYTAFEPNSQHYNRFLEKVNKASFGENIEILIHNDCYEADDFKSKEQYDLVVLSHVLYYFNEPLDIIKNAINQTKENGKVVIVHQTATGIPEIQQEYMLEVKGDQDEMLTAEDIRNLLEIESYQHQFHCIEAHLDVTQCLMRSQKGIQIMSFCMECDLRQLTEDKLTKIIKAFENLAEIEESQKALIKEPIGIFVLKGSQKTDILPRNPEDKDPVIDYWQLAQHFDWSKQFSSLHNQSHNSSLKLLDVACGTGRWLQAFNYYIQLQENINEIQYDFLDPCETSISQASQKIFSPFKRGSQYINTIQSAQLETNHYDLLWSMHGFYMVPRQDLSSVLKRCASVLNQTGVGYIALATRKSFYVDFYEQYLQIFKEGKGERFTSAEDVIESLNKCGIKHQVHRIFYEEAIKADDYAGLEHYIKNEATINCFNKDQEVEPLSESKNITLEDLLSHPKMKVYLDSLVRNSVYYFPEEILLISFNGN